MSKEQELKVEGLTNPSNSTYLYTTNRIPYLPIDNKNDHKVLESLGYKVNSDIKFSTEYNTPYLPMYFGLLVDDKVTYDILLEKHENDFNTYEKEYGYQSSFINEDLLQSDHKLTKNTTVRNNLELADENTSVNPLLGIYKTSEGNGTDKYLEVLKNRSAIALKIFAGQSNTLFSSIINDTLNKTIDRHDSFVLFPLDMSLLLTPTDGSYLIPSERFNLHYVNYDSYLEYKEDLPLTVKDTLTIVTSLTNPDIYIQRHNVTGNLANPFRTPLKLVHSEYNISYLPINQEVKDIIELEDTNSPIEVDDPYYAYRHNKYRYTLDSSKHSLFLSSRYAEITNTAYYPNKDYESSLKDDLYFSINYFEDVRGNSNLVRDITNYLTLKKFNTNPKVDEIKSTLDYELQESKLIGKVKVSDEMVKEITRKYK